MLEPRSIPSPPGSPIAPSPPPGYERHCLGRFGEGVISFLGRDAAFGKIGEDKIYIIIDSIELGDNPLEEELGVEFHASRARPAPGHVPFRGRPMPGQEIHHAFNPQENIFSEATHLSFVFTSEIPLGENIKDFLDFLESETGMIPDEGRVAIPEAEERSSPEDAPVASPGVATIHPGHQASR